jgi:hypothetical protein
MNQVPVGQRIPRGRRVRFAPGTTQEYRHLHRGDRRFLERIIQAVSESLLRPNAGVNVVEREAEARRRELGRPDPGNTRPYTYEQRYFYNYFNKTTFAEAVGLTLGYKPSVPSYNILEIDSRMWDPDWNYKNHWHWIYRIFAPIVGSYKASSIASAESYTYGRVSRPKSIELTARRWAMRQFRNFRATNRDEIARNQAALVIQRVVHRFNAAMDLT